MLRHVALLAALVLVEGHRDASQGLLETDLESEDESGGTWSETEAKLQLDKFLNQQDPNRCARWGCAKSLGSQNECVLPNEHELSHHCGTGFSGRTARYLDPRKECLRQMERGMKDCLLWAPTCRLVTLKEWERESSTLLSDKTSELHNPALQFCSLLLKDAPSKFDFEGKWLLRRVMFSGSGQGSTEEDAHKVRRALQDTLQVDAAESICQAAVKGSVDAASAVASLEGRKPGLLRRVWNWMTGKDTEGPGNRLELLNKISRHASHAFHHVCQDECDDLIKQMREQAGYMSELYLSGSGSPADACAELVVRRVESHLISCCAKACGWDGRVCMRWPFLNKTDQDEWLSQCCAEDVIFRGSERERLCNSANPSLRKQLVQGDPPPDFAGQPLEIGQDEILVWTEKGANHRLGWLAFVKAGDLVYGHFLNEQPLSVWEGIVLGFWKVASSESSEPQHSFAGSVWDPAQIAQKMHEGMIHPVWQVPPSAALKYGLPALIQVQGRNVDCDKPIDATCHDTAKAWTSHGCAKSKKWKKVAAKTTSIIKSSQAGRPEAALSTQACRDKLHNDYEATFVTWEWPQQTFSNPQPCKLWASSFLWSQLELEELVIDSQQGLKDAKKKQILEGSIIYIYHKDW